MTKKVLITDYVWPSVEPEKTVLAKADATLIIAPNGDESTLINLAKDVDGILTCFAKVTDKVVESAEKCVVIGRYGVGVDNIAVDKATEQGIVVTYVPDYCVDEVSDHVIGLILAWNRRIVLFDRATKNKGWGVEGLGMRMMRLRGKVMGIVGFGRIGRAVADKARGFGMTILASDPVVDAESVERGGAKKVEMDELLRASDFISLHSPLIPSTIHMIGRKELAVMKSEAFIVNAARGGLIDEDALFEEDVAPPLDHRLIQHENIIVTPHTAFFSQEAVLELEERAAGEVAKVFQSEMPDNVVNSEVLSRNNLRATGLDL